MNQPYVKKYTSNGVIINPITEKGYVSWTANRRSRRQDHKKHRKQSIKYVQTILMEREVTMPVYSYGIPMDQWPKKTYIMPRVKKVIHYK